MDKAIKSQKGHCLKRLIHHSDRGSQYVDIKYRNQLLAEGIWISMGDSAVENAYAERLNGTIKNEFLKGWTINSYRQLKRKVSTAVKYYNKHRIHDHLPLKQCPDQFNDQLSTLQNRPVEIIYTHKKPELKKIFKNLKNQILPTGQLTCPIVYC